MEVRAHAQDVAAGVYADAEEADHAVGRSEAVERGGQALVADRHQGGVRVELAGEALGEAGDVGRAQESAEHAVVQVGVDEGDGLPEAAGDHAGQAEGQLGSLLAVVRTDEHEAVHRLVEAQPLDGGDDAGHGVLRARTPGAERRDASEDRQVDRVGDVLGGLDHRSAQVPHDEEEERHQAAEQEAEEDREPQREARGALQRAVDLLEHGPLDALVDGGVLLGRFEHRGECRDDLCADRLGLLPVGAGGDDIHVGRLGRTARRDHRGDRVDRLGQLAAPLHLGREALGLDDALERPGQDLVVVGVLAAHDHEAAGGLVDRRVDRRQRPRERSGDDHGRDDDDHLGTGQAGGPADLGGAGLRLELGDRSRRCSHRGHRPFVSSRPLPGLPRPVRRELRSVPMGPAASKPPLSIPF